MNGLDRESGISRSLSLTFMLERGFLLLAFCRMGNTRQKIPLGRTQWDYFDIVVIEVFKSGIRQIFM